MIRFRFNSSYEFCDFSIPDQEDLGTYLIWTFEAFAEHHELPFEISDDLNGYEVSIEGAETQSERECYLGLYKAAVAQVRQDVEEGLI